MTAMTTPFATDIRCHMTVALSILRSSVVAVTPVVPEPHVPVVTTLTKSRETMATPFATDIRCHMTVALSILRAYAVPVPTQRLMSTDT